MFIAIKIYKRNLFAESTIYNRQIAVNIFNIIDFIISLWLFLNWKFATVQSMNTKMYHSNRKCQGRYKCQSITEVKKFQGIWRKVHKQIDKLLYCMVGYLTTDEPFDLFVSWNLMLRAILTIFLHVAKCKFPKHFSGFSSKVFKEYDFSIDRFLRAAQTKDQFWFQQNVHVFYLIFNPFFLITLYLIVFRIPSDTGNYLETPNKWAQILFSTFFKLSHFFHEFNTKPSVERLPKIITS